MPRNITPQKIKLTSVEEADFEELVALRIEAMRESLERIGRYDPIRARERFRYGFSPEYTRQILVEEQRIGFVVLKPVEGALLLDHLYICPGFQGRGIGSIVLAQLFREADALSLPIRVGALRESEANRFYVKHGFQKMDEEEFDIYYIRPHA